MIDLALQQRAANIADRVASDELQFQRACGEDWITAYTESWRAFDETYRFIIYHRQSDYPITRATHHARRP